MLFFLLNSLNKIHAFYQVSSYCLLLPALVQDA
jgi:hypothetical protein